QHAGGVEEIPGTDRRGAGHVDDHGFNTAIARIHNLLEAPVVVSGSLSVIRCRSWWRCGPWLRMCRFVATDHRPLTTDPWRRQDGHPAAANQAIVPAVVVVEVESEDFGLAGAGGEDGEGALFDLGLDATAAQRAALAAVGKDQHGGASLLRRGAARLDD